MSQDLARNKLRTGLREMAQRLPDLRLACDPSEIEMCRFGIRVVRNIPVTRGWSGLGAAAARSNFALRPRCYWKWVRSA